MRNADNLSRSRYIESSRLIENFVSKSFIAS